MPREGRRKSKRKHRTSRADSMLKEEHWILSGIAILLAWKLSLLTILPEIGLLSFGATFLFFSFLCSPDIDIPLNEFGLTRHRGNLHEPIFIIIFGALLYLSLSYISLTNSDMLILGTLAPYVASGFVLAYFVHLVGDWLHDHIMKNNTLWRAVLAASALAIVVWK